MIRFHGDLRTFLPYARRDRPFDIVAADRAAIKEVVEALGVPHVEIGVLLVGGALVGFDYRVRESDEIDVYPVGMAPPGVAARSLQPEPPRPARIVLDVQLGRLAAYLRMLGFDTLYQIACDDDVLARLSSSEQRILLTRDVGLLKRREVSCGHFMRVTHPERQFEEIMWRHALMPEIAPFRRCARCNGLLAPVPKGEVLERVPALVRERFDEFKSCLVCGQVY
jgi:uncharacterized protein with PIN domain